MNAKCLICSDLFVPHSDIWTTNCGHLFHYNCILQWLDRSKTCPQCRTKTTEKTIHKIFISVDDCDVGNKDDPASLKNQNDYLQFQLRLRTTDVDRYKEEANVKEIQAIALRKEVKDLEGKISMLESALHALKDQVKYFKAQAKDYKKLQEESVILKNKLSSLETVQLAVRGSYEQVTDMLRHNCDPNSLAVLVETLKKELVESDRRKKQGQVLLRDAEHKIQKKLQELNDLSKRNSKLLQEVEAHKNCHLEQLYLKEKIEELQRSATKRSMAHNNTVHRIVHESPIPLPREADVSLSVPEKVQAIKESESPYLKVQFSNAGLSELMNNAQATNKSIFNHPRHKAQTLKKPSFASYDGLGGHSRDEQFPSERHSIMNKRPKSTSSVSSAKIRKLTPLQSKISNFFNP